MKKLILFLEQISKSVLPHKYYNIINNPYIRIFRLISCISIIVLFVFKNSINPYIIYILLVIGYFYMCYQCIFITMKIYCIFNTINKHEIKNVNFYIPLTYINIFYNIIRISIIIVGLPILGDTIIEILGDIKYVIEQILLKKKK